RGFKAQPVITRAVNTIRHSTSKVHDAWLYLVNYQAYLEKQNTNSEWTEQEQNIQQRREDAKIVAEFCYNRSYIAEKMTKV
ncbi:hypothetical protein ACO1MN_16290, partial [Staphylococcus aureus]